MRKPKRTGLAKKSRKQIFAEIDRALPQSDGKARAFFPLGPARKFKKPLKVWITPASREQFEALPDLRVEADAAILAMERRRDRLMRAYKCEEGPKTPKLDELNRLAMAIVNAKPGTAAGMEAKFRILLEWGNDYGWDETHRGMVRAIRRDIRRLLPGRR